MIEYVLKPGSVVSNSLSEPLRTEKIFRHVSVSSFKSPLKTNLFFNFFNFVCACCLSLCMYMHHVYAVLAEARGGVGCPGIRVTDSCETPCGH